MKEVNIEIVIVDDVLSAAQEYERLIRSTGLGVTSTDDPEIALELVRANAVKVVVLDQRMPRMTGTALFRVLREIDPKLQMEKRRFLSKKNIDHLK